MHGVKLISQVKFTCVSMDASKTNVLKNGIKHSILGPFKRNDCPRSTDYGVECAARA